MYYRNCVVYVVGLHKFPIEVIIYLCCYAIKHLSANSLREWFIKPWRSSWKNPYLRLPARLPSGAQLWAPSPNNCRARREQFQSNRAYQIRVGPIAYCVSFPDYLFISAVINNHSICWCKLISHLAIHLHHLFFFLKKRNSNQQEDFMEEVIQIPGGVVFDRRMFRC